MASLFSARRKPKRIVRQEHDPTEEQEVDQNTSPVVRRPTAAPKAQSKLRLSFNPGEANTANEESEDVPIKANRLGASTTARDLPRHAAALNISERQESERPTYNKSYLDELRNSTPSTPKDISLYNSSAEEDQDVSSAVDIASKFGHTSRDGIAVGPSIPSAAEIQEKKDRRARLAKEQQAGVIQQDDGFIPLEDYDSDGEFNPQRMQVGMYNQPDRYDEKNTRLIRDDEDFAEGFDEYVEDGASNRILMSKSGRREDEYKEKERRKEMIQDAEGGSEEEDSDSDASLRHAYESAQTHHGMEGLEARMVRDRLANRPKQPDKTVPIPTLSTALGRIRELVQQAEAKKLESEKRLKEIEEEKLSVQADQAQIQKSLTELGEELERSMMKTNGDMSNGRDDTRSEQRGLENFGHE